MPRAKRQHAYCNWFCVRVTSCVFIQKRFDQNRIRRDCNLEQGLKTCPPVHNAPSEYILEQFSGYSDASLSLCDVAQGWSFCAGREALQMLFLVLGPLLCKVPSPTIFPLPSSQYRRVQVPLLCGASVGRLCRHRRGRDRVRYGWQSIPRGLLKE